MIAVILGIEPNDASGFLQPAQHRNYPPLCPGTPSPRFFRFLLPALASLSSAPCSSTTPSARSPFSRASAPPYFRCEHIFAPRCKSFFPVPAWRTRESLCNAFPKTDQKQGSDQPEQHALTADNAELVRGVPSSYVALQEMRRFLSFLSKMTLVQHDIETDQKWMRYARDFRADHTCTDVGRMDCITSSAIRSAVLGSLKHSL